MWLPSRRKLRRMVSGRDEDVGRLGVIMVLRRAQETEALFGNLQIAGTGIRRLFAVVVCNCSYFVCSKAGIIPNQF